MIDVIMPVRNGEKYIRQAIESLQAQSENKWRLFVLDHKSTDKSIEVVKRMAIVDKRIVPINASECKSLAAVRNVGLECCDRDLIMLHDADDISVEGRISLSMRAFEKNPDMIAIGGQSRLIDGDGGHVGFMLRTTDRDRVRAAAMFSNPIAQPTVTLKRSGLVEHGIKYGKNFISPVVSDDDNKFGSLVEDYLLFGQLAVLNKVMNINETLINYRLHGGNVSAVNHRHQMRLSLDVSRQLIYNISSICSLNYCDPALLCNHSGRLFSLPSEKNTELIFQNIANNLRSAFGTTAGTERELAFRKVIATRSALKLSTNFLSFRARHKPEMDEAVCLREWFIGPLLGRPRVAAQDDTMIT